MSDLTDINKQVAAIARKEGGRVLSVLAGNLKSLELAEEALQEAYTSALQHWGRSGLPANPSAWLLQVGRRKAIDKIRRNKKFRELEPELEHLLQTEAQGTEHGEDFEIPDERLRLIFTCCHPAIEQGASVALTLRTLCGLTTEEIAKAFLASRDTMAQRLVRAQQKIAKAKIPYEVPDQADLPGRLEAVLAVIYLIFNEGYASSSGDYIRVDLCEEATRLTKLVISLLPKEPEPEGLLALILLHRSRFATRLTEGKTMIALEEQDRTQWDKQLIAQGVAILERVLRQGRPGSYQLQAAIAAIHCEAKTFAETDWSEIALIYQKLYEMSPNPVVELNRLVAISYSDGPGTALPLLQALGSELAKYQPYHATLADVLMRSGDKANAAHAYGRAIKLSENEAEKLFLKQKLQALN